MTSVHRFEVRPKPSAGDPRADAIQRDAAAIGIALADVETTRVYFVQGQLSRDHIDAIERAILTDPVIEVTTRDAAPADAVVVEVHPLPGVMDPASQSVRDAIRDLTGAETSVLTGWRYDLVGVSTEQAFTLARRLLANPVVHEVHLEPWTPEKLPEGHERAFEVTHVPVTRLDDDGLARLSREAHLFLSPDEMRTIRDQYRTLGREPTDIELETLAQTWSEHCVHKTLKSKIRYRHQGTGAPGYRGTDSEQAPPRTSPPEGGGERSEPEGAFDTIDWSNRPGHTINDDGAVTIDNLLRSTVAAATHELIADGVDWTLSVFVDNAGVIAFDDENAVCVKVETHNHPSAIEPYGGAATGAGGCIRDIIGTGLAARPIANTDVFCVASPDLEDIPDGCLHPRRILTEVVAGVRDYGNRMGIPTLNGAVHFDDRYVGNPLVFCGCVGVMPRNRVEGDPRAGDLIVALGGRTGRDGIHGATFSSSELTDTHADEFSHAVQIGNAIEEKRVLDAIMRARDDQQDPLFSAITDCGAGGFSSAIGEMGERLGAEVHLDRAPLKYAGLSYTEIWISEAQERMVLAVPPDRLDALRAICDQERVELAVLGEFGTPGRELILNYAGAEVGRMPMEFLHDGIPTPTREATWSARTIGHAATDPQPAVRDALPTLLADPNVASKRFIIRQYDHEVQGNTIVKPLVGPGGQGAGDGGVIEPVPGTGRGLAIACGLNIGVGDPSLGGDPYQMALAGIDECVRNLVCVGADPERIAILDNFCWPSCQKAENLGALVRACEGCYDGAKAFRTPFVSGKDSLNNQFTTETGRTIEIPYTLLISGIGIVSDLRRIVTSDAKEAGRVLVLVSAGDRAAMLGSLYHRLFGLADAGGVRTLPAVDLASTPSGARFVASLIARRLVHSAHDVSDGGLLVAIGEMLIGGSTEARPLGASIELDGDLPDIAACFSESGSCYVLEMERADAEALSPPEGLRCFVLGELTESGSLEVRTPSGGTAAWSVGELGEAWLGTLDW